MNALAGLLRERIRAGHHTTVTTGLAPGHLQANLVILPADEAARPPFCITHKAGHMLITDRLNEEFGEPR